MMTNDIVSLLEEIKHNAETVYNYEDPKRDDKIEALNYAICAVESNEHHGEWVAVYPDSRGYANDFRCSECGGYVCLGYYSRECDYEYCPYCGRKTD